MPLIVVLLAIYSMLQKGGFSFQYTQTNIPVYYNTTYDFLKDTQCTFARLNGTHQTLYFSVNGSLTKIKDIDMLGLGRVEKVQLKPSSPSTTVLIYHTKGLSIHQIFPGNVSLISNYTYSQYQKHIFCGFSGAGFIFLYSISSRKLCRVNENHPGNFFTCGAIDELKSCSFDTFLAVSTFNNNNCLYSLYDANLNLTKSMSYNNCNPSSQLEFNYNNEASFITITEQNQLQIWDTISLQNIRNISFNGSNQIINAIICRDLIFVIETYYYIFYDLYSNQAIIRIPNLLGIEYNFSKLKCFSDSNKIGFKYSKSNGESFIRYISFTSNLTSSSSENLQAMSDTQKRMLQTTNFINQIFMSNVSWNILQITSQVSSITSSSTFTRSLLHSFINLLDQFRFYAFHIQTYPKFVQIFTQQIDILSQLRIKPRFLDFEIKVSQFTEENQRLNQTNLLQQRAPQNILVFQSLKYVYTTNLGTVLLTFVITKILYLILKLLRKNYKSFTKLFKILAENSRWWTIILGFFECNIATISFYCCVQFNVFVCFNMFSKFNFIFGLFAFFSVLIYSFLFYPLIYQYGKHKSIVKIFDLSQCKRDSFWLEMTIKCLRSLLQSLVHGLFINHHQGQLIGLIILDFCFVLASIRMRKLFSYKVVFVQITLFFFAFLLFDITLLFYTNDINSKKTYTYMKDLTYNFIITVQVLTILLIKIIRILSKFVIFIYEMVVKIRKKQKIVDWILKAQNTKIKKPIYSLNSQKGKKNVKIKHLSFEDQQLGTKQKQAGKKKKKICFLIKKKSDSSQLRKPNNISPFNEAANKKKINKIINQIQKFRMEIKCL